MTFEPSSGGGEEASCQETGGRVFQAEGTAKDMRQEASVAGVRGENRLEAKKRVEGGGGPLKDLDFDSK